MRLKGHTKIELTNVRTGEKKNYEKDNFVTNLFRDAMQPCGAYGSLREYFKNNKKQAQAALLEMTRGIVLFDSTLPANPDEYTLPAGVNMVGRGIDTAYNGTDKTLGSYNASESVIDNDGTNVGYKYVWDFTTQQANGIIKSICLCPTASAEIGFGKSNVVEDNNNIRLWQKELENYINAEGATYPNYDSRNDQKDMVWMDFSKNRLLRVTSGFTSNSRQAGSLFNDKSIIISEYRIPISNISIFDSYNATERRNTAPTKTYTVAMPEELISLCKEANVYRGFETRVDQSKGILSIILLPESKCSISAGGTIYAWEINLNTMTSDVKKYTNNTGYMLGGSTSYESVNYHCIYEVEDYLVVYIPKSTGTQKICCISKESGECKDITLMDGSAIPFKSDGFCQDCIRTGNMLICGRNNYLDSTKVAAYFMIDCVTGTLKNIECYSNYNSVGSGSNGYFYDYVIGTGSRKYMMIQSAKAYLYPFVFFTINNLDAPIEKTDEQAMKIIYTLTKAE